MVWEGTWILDQSGRKNARGRWHWMAGKICVNSSHNHAGSNGRTLTRNRSRHRKKVSQRHVRQMKIITGGGKKTYKAGHRPGTQSVSVANWCCPLSRLAVFGAVRSVCEESAHCKNIHVKITVVSHRESRYASGKIALTSMRLFSLDAASKSLSWMPFATLHHKVRLSHLACSSIGRTVTSSLGPVTSMNGTPLFVSLLVVFHCPSKHSPTTHQDVERKRVGEKGSLLATGQEVKRKRAGEGIHMLKSVRNWSGCEKRVSLRRAPTH